MLYASEAGPKASAAVLPLFCFPDAAVQEGVRKGHVFPEDQLGFNTCLGAFGTVGRVTGPQGPPSRHRRPVLGSGWVSTYLKTRLTLQDFFPLGEDSEQRAEVSSRPLVVSKVLQILLTDRGFVPLPLCS